jgi:hypothetical protein
MKRIIGFRAFVLSPYFLFGSYVVDNAETGTNTVTSGGSWITFSEGTSLISFTHDITPGESGTYCREIAWTFYVGTPDNDPYGHFVSCQKDGIYSISVLTEKGATCQGRFIIIR